MNRVHSGRSAAMRWIFLVLVLAACAHKPVCGVDAAKFGQASFDDKASQCAKGDGQR